MNCGHRLAISRWLFVLIPGVVLMGACASSAEEAAPSGRVEYFQPEGLHRNPAFSQAVTVDGPARMVYVGGQNAVSAEGAIVGIGDIVQQAAQVARNLRIALQAGGARPEHVIQWNVYVVEGQALGPAFAEFQKIFAGEFPAPPLVTVLYVAGLAHPGFLLEVSAIAAVPE